MNQTMPNVLSMPAVDPLARISMELLWGLDQSVMVNASDPMVNAW